MEVISKNLYVHQVEASINDKIKRSCIYLGGVIAMNYFYCEEKKSKENVIFFLKNIEIVTIFETVKIG